MQIFICTINIFIILLFSIKKSLKSSRTSEKNSTVYTSLHVRKPPVFSLFSVTMKIAKGKTMDDGMKKMLYRAFCARDPRFDGRYFIGIRSTGIYCRPVCHARKPKFENCEFFSSAAEAEKAGYRPCLQCRPELAPGSVLTGAPVDARERLARVAARYLRETCGSGMSLEDLAKNLGVSSRHLRRVFEEKYQVKPVDYLTTCRLLLAKNLLTDSRLPVTEIAYASGFRSLRRFNEVFQKKYHLTPSGLRKNLRDTAEKTTDDVPGDSFTMALGYRPPYRYDLLLAFWKPRLLKGIETINKGVYSRGVQLSDGRGQRLTGWFQAWNQPEKNRLCLRISASLLPVLPELLRRVHLLFDLDADPEIVQESLSDFREMTGTEFIPGIRIAGAFDPFEMGVRAVLGQLIRTDTASVLAGKFASVYGTQIKEAPEGITHAFPTAEDFLKKAGESDAAEALGSLGIFRKKTQAILTYAGFLESREKSWWLTTPQEKISQELQELPGIGPWTADYIVMRAFGWTDAFPVSDLAVKKALTPRKKDEMLALADAWRPWRSYATFCLWQKGEKNDVLYDNGQPAGRNHPQQHR